MLNPSEQSIIKKAQLTYRALNHKLRQSILQTLLTGETMTVTELYIHLRLDQSVCSQHLAILRHAGIVNVVRHGKEKHYSVNMDRIHEILESAKSLVAQ